MQILSSCTQAIRDCKETHSFAVAHLYNDDVPMKMHIHDTYESPATSSLSTSSKVTIFPNWTKQPTNASSFRSTLRT